MKNCQTEFYVIIPTGLFLLTVISQGVKYEINKK